MLRRRVATGSPLLCRRFSPSTCFPSTQVLALANGLAAQEADATPSTTEATAAAPASAAATSVRCDDAVAVASTSARV